MDVGDSKASARECIVILMPWHRLKPRLLDAPLVNVSKSTNTKTKHYRIVPIGYAHCISDKR